MAYIFQICKGGKVSKESRMKKIVVVVGEDVAYSIGMRVEVAEIKVNAILRRYAISPSTFISVAFENGKILIRTTSAIIECDRRMTTSKIAPPSAKNTVGKNFSAYKRPIRSTGKNGNE